MEGGGTVRGEKEERCEEGIAGEERSEEGRGDQDNRGIHLVSATIRPKVSTKTTNRSEEHTSELSHL